MLTLVVLCPGSKIEELDLTHVCCRIELPCSHVAWVRLLCRQAIGHLCLHLECDAAKVATVLGLSRVLGQAEHCSWTCRHSRGLRRLTTAPPRDLEDRAFKHCLISWHDELHEDFAYKAGKNVQCVPPHPADTLALLTQLQHSRVKRAKVLAGFYSDD